MSRARRAATRRAATRRVRNWIVVAVILALLLGFVAEFRHSVWHQVSLSIIRKQPVYNALYFTEPQDLPSHIPTGVVSQFSFDIKRVGPPTNVRYTIELSDAEGTTLLTGRDVLLDARELRVISEQFSVPVAGAFEVGVTLSSRNTRIDFHGQAS